MDGAQASGEPVFRMDAEHFDDSSASWWREEACSPALVERVVRDISERTPAEHDILLSDLLCAAWPAPRSQMQ